MTLAKILPACCRNTGPNSSLEGALDKSLPAAGGPDPEKLQKQLNDAQAKLASLKTARDKQTAPLHARIEKLERQNDSLDQELAKLRANNDALLDALAQRDRKLSEYAAREQAPENLPELPGSNIVFAGGHPNMTKKLRQKYPGWTFIEGDEPGFQVFLCGQVFVQGAGDGIFHCVCE